MTGFGKPTLLGPATCFENNNSEQRSRTAVRAHGARNRHHLSAGPVTTELSNSKSSTAKGLNFPFTALRMLRRAGAATIRAFYSEPELKSGPRRVPGAGARAGVRAGAGTGTRAGAGDRARVRAGGGAGIGAGPVLM